VDFLLGRLAGHFGLILGDDQDLRRRAGV